MSIGCSAGLSPVCLSVCLSVCLHVYWLLSWTASSQSVSQSVCLSVYNSCLVSQSVFLNLLLSQSVSLSACLLVAQLDCLQSVCLSGTSTHTMYLGSCIQASLDYNLKVGTMRFVSSFHHVSRHYNDHISIEAVTSLYL